MHTRKQSSEIRSWNYGLTSISIPSNVVAKIQQFDVGANTLLKDVVCYSVFLPRMGKCQSDVTVKVRPMGHHTK